MKYIFTSQRQEIGNFEIDADSNDDALDILRFELECHDRWTVTPLDNKFLLFKVYLNEKYVDTLVASKASEDVINKS